MLKIKAFLKTQLARQLAVILLPFLVLVGLVGHYGDNIPVNVQYEMFPLFQNVDSCTLGFSDLWKQQNEHRIFFPKTAQVGVGLATHWDIRAEVITSLMVAVAGFAALFLIIRRSQLSEVAKLVLLGAASLWFFSPVQWENWLWGWQLEWFMCMAAALWAFYLLSIIKSENRISKALVGAALAGIIAT